MRKYRLDEVTSSINYDHIWAPELLNQCTNVLSTLMHFQELPWVDHVEQLTEHSISTARDLDLDFEAAQRIGLAVCTHEYGIFAINSGAQGNQSSDLESYLAARFHGIQQWYREPLQNVNHTSVRCFLGQERQIPLMRADRHEGDFYSMYEAIIEHVNATTDTALREHPEVLDLVQRARQIRIHKQPDQSMEVNVFGYWDIILDHMERSPQCPTDALYDKVTNRFGIPRDLVDTPTFQTYMDDMARARAKPL